MQRLVAAFVASVLLSPLAACASPTTADPPGTRVELDEEAAPSRFKDRLPPPP